MSRCIIDIGFSFHIHDLYLDLNMITISELGDALVITPFLSLGKVLVQVSGGESSGILEDHPQFLQTTLVISC